MEKLKVSREFVLEAHEAACPEWRRKIEKEIPENALVGKALFKIPKIGWIKLFVVDIINIFRR